MKNKLIVKFNGGTPVVLCSSCSVILRYWKDFAQEEKDFVLTGKGALPKALCPKCEKLSKHVV
jgi:hypothetical protein